MDVIYVPKKQWSCEYNNYIGFGVEDLTIFFGR